MRSSTTDNGGTPRSGWSARSNTSSATPTTRPEIKRADRAKPGAHESLHRTQGGSIEAQFQALRYFALDGTDHDSHEARARMIRRYNAWRNRHARDIKLQEVIKRANAA